MTDITTTLKQCHEIVWSYRDQLKDVWKIPPVEDCLLFSFCELGEAIDAHLRSKPQYARNNAKDLDVLDELADCAMMLLTALGPHRRVIILEDEPINHFTPREWAGFVDDFESILSWYGDPENGSIWAESAVICLERIMTYPGMDLPTRLTARLERIKAKQLPKEVAA